MPRPLAPREPDPGRQSPETLLFPSCEPRALRDTEGHRPGPSASSECGPHAPVPGALFRECTHRHPPGAGNASRKAQQGREHTPSGLPRGARSCSDLHAGAAFRGTPSRDACACGQRVPSRLLPPLRARWAPQSPGIGTITPVLRSSKLLSMPCDPMINMRR